MGSTTKDILVAARGLVAHGWCQGHAYRQAQDEYCALGAVNNVGVTAQNLCRHMEARELLKNAVSKRNFGDRDVVRFNDALGRTQADVLEVFDMAIEAAP